MLEFTTEKEYRIYHGDGWGYTIGLFDNDYFYISYWEDSPSNIKSTSEMILIDVIPNIIELLVDIARDKNIKCEENVVDKINDNLYRLIKGE